MVLNYDPHTILQSFTATWLPATIQAAMLRLDLLHPDIQGNKWFKLKYNFEAAERAGKRRLLTFGGAYSNHIAATAAACQLIHWPCTAIIRGEKPPVLSHTLQRATAAGMELIFISRESYRNKYDTDWESLFPDHYVVPEGGHNAEGARGCEDILSLVPTNSYTHIISAVGTGTTLAGLINAAGPDQLVTGISALKGALSLNDDIQELVKPGATASWQLLHDHHQGGYGKIPAEVTAFMNDFYRQTHIPLDGVYTAKMMLAFKNLIQSGYLPAGANVLCIHTGGLQGNLSLAPGVLCF